MTQSWKNGAEILTCTMYLKSDFLQMKTTEKRYTQKNQRRRFPEHFNHLKHLPQTNHCGSIHAG